MCEFDMMFDTRVSIYDYRYTIVDATIWNMLLDCSFFVRQSSDHAHLNIKSLFMLNAKCDHLNPHLCCLFSRHPDEVSAPAAFGKVSPWAAVGIPYSVTLLTAILDVTSFV